MCRKASRRLRAATDSMQTLDPVNAVTSSPKISESERARRNQSPAFVDRLANHMANLRYRIVSAHGSLPYYPGKYRIGHALSKSCRFPEVVTVRRRGILYRLDPSSITHRQILTDGVYSPAESAFVRKRLKPSMVAIDVGANVGYFTLMFSRLVGHAGKVFAFEPTHRSFQFLTENISLNQCPNVVAFNGAVDEQSGCLQLAEAQSYAESETNFMLLSKGNTSTVTIDSLHLWKLDFLKTDTEGFEFRVLRGAQATLRRCRPTILFEINPAALARYGDTAGGLIHFVSSFGYRLWRPTVWKGLQPLEEPGQGQWCNTVAIPASNV
jgi:FkbM family methyltransferase